MQHATVALLTEADYLAGEPYSAIRHEYVDGYIYAMTGASKGHNTIVLNIATRLHAHLRGSPCRAYVADMRVRVETARAYYYPDVVVTCAGPDTAADAPSHYLTAPVLIAEILSETTETLDRREKMRAYAQLDSLREYLLVDSRSARAELYRTRPDGGWEQWIAAPGETLRLDSVGLDLAVADLYEDVTF